MAANKSNTISIYIPRILGNVKRQDIVDSFHNLDIGKVNYLDMHKKINDNRRAYYFAFITIELYASSSAAQLLQKLNTHGIDRLVYDEESNNYWEIKKYISRELRTPSPPVVVENNDTFQNIGTLIDKENFDLVKEYESLQREIYALCQYQY